MSIPATEYVVVNKQPSGRTGQQPQQQQQQAAPQQQKKQVPIPKGLPRFMGNRGTIFAAWGASMILVGFDEWHNYHILPRPARFWYTSLTYGLLMLASMVDALVPLCNALALGFTFVLLWQYYQGSGQFAQGSQ